MQPSDGESLAASSLPDLRRDTAVNSALEMDISETEDSGEGCRLPGSSSSSSGALSMDVASEPEATDVAVEKARKLHSGEGSRLLGSSASSSGALSMDVASEPEATDVAVVSDTQLQASRQEGLLPWSMTWASHLVCALTELVPVADIKKTFLAQGRQTFFSTFCSGIGCPELALQCLTRAAQIFSSFDVHVSASSACDINSSCRLVLAKRVPGAHIFKDIFHEFPGWARDATLTPSEQVARLKAFYRPGVARPCSAHSQPCLEPPVDGHVLGSPCQPWSAYGRRLRHSDARTCVLYAWMAKVLVDQPRWGVHENVRGFDLSFMEQILSPVYRILHFQISPADLGCSLVKRPRLYSMLLHRTKTTVVRDPEARPRVAGFFLITNIASLARKLFPNQVLMRELLGRMKSFRPTLVIKDFLVATPTILVAHENAMRAKRHLAPLTTWSGDWRYLLCPSARKHLRRPSRQCVDDAFTYT